MLSWLRRDLPEEASGPSATRELGPEHLDGHAAAVPQIVRQVHRRHAAAAELALDRIAPGQRRSQPRGGKARGGISLGHYVAASTAGQPSVSKNGMHADSGRDRSASRTMIPGAPLKRLSG